MAELPDVESFRRYFDATSLHQRIDDVDVRNAYVLKGVSGRELARRLKGRSFESTRRHGKHLFVRADSNVWLRLHFGMSGFLRYFKGEEKAPPHTRVLFVFAKDYRLAFDDQRKFGEVGLVNEVDEFLKKRALVSDARAVTGKVLLTGRPGCGKTTLIKRVVNNLARRAGGFYTEEMRQYGARVGFKIVTLDGNEAVFAHVDFKTPERVGKYGLDLSALEAVGVESVREAARRQRIVVIDEIGPMEIRSPIFREAVNEALDSEVQLLATR